MTVTRTVTKTTLTLALMLSSAGSASPAPQDAPDAPDAQHPAPANESRHAGANERASASNVPSAASERPSIAVPVVHAAALMGGMRLSLSLLWPEAFNPFPVRRSVDTFRTNWSTGPDFRPDRALFESDGDPWPLNAVGHGLFGSEVYLRTRQCGHGALASLGATIAASTIWEYGIEAFHKRPSAVDLLWTPLSGIAFGELRYQLMRAMPGSAAVRIVLDPLGEAERALGTGC